MAANLAHAYMYASMVPSYIFCRGTNSKICYIQHFNSQAQHNRSKKIIEAHDGLREKSTQFKRLGWVPRANNAQMGLLLGSLQTDHDHLVHATGVWPVAEAFELSLLFSV